MNECLPAVSTTPAKKEKNFEIKMFKIFYYLLVYCTLHQKIELLLIYHF